MVGLSQMERQCSHQCPDWDLRHRLLEVMDTSNMRNQVFVMARRSNQCDTSAFTLRVTVVAVAELPTRCHVTPAQMPTRFWFNVLHIVSVSVLRAQDTCDGDVTGGPY